MSKNGISHLPTRQERQEAKLAIAAAKRQGKVVAEDGTISGDVDPNAPWYRENNYLLIDRLPTKYAGDTVVDNPNPDGLLPHRPWDVQPS